MDEEFQSYLRFHYALQCRNCKELVMDPDKAKGQQYLRGKCPSCGKESKAPPVDIQNVKLSKRQRKRLKKEMAEQKRLADKIARGKYVDDAGSGP
jgi:DNA-directed RNA polymerase subunit M/transcription elongation factor TFIIS